MKKIILAAALFLCATLLPSTPLSAQHSSSGELPYKSGEEAEFAISFIAKIVPNIDMARLNVKVSDDRVDGAAAYHINAFARTTVARWAYKMDNTYDAWIDKQTHLPLRATCDVRENDYRYNNEYIYDWAGDELRIKSSRSGKYTDRETTLQLEQSSRDIVSLIYSLRSANIVTPRDGKQNILTLLNNEAVRHLKYRYAGRETIKIKGLGEVKTIHFICEITTSEGEPFETGNELHLWLTDDANRMPVFVESPIKWGKLRARIVNYKNLKFPQASVLPKQ